MSSEEGTTLFDFCPFLPESSETSKFGFVIYVKYSEFCKFSSCSPPAASYTSSSSPIPLPSDFINKLDYLAFDF